MKKIIFTLLLGSLFLGACLHTADIAEVGNTAKGKRPKNIILMIGDGMGLAQITAGLYQNNNHLALEAFPIVGLHKNYPDEKGDLITDSAAGATSFACGVKTYNAAIGVGSDSLPRTTILELAEKKGLATGLVATCNIQHATPGSFIAHVKHRSNYEEISEWFTKTDVDLFIGGGKKYFDSRVKDNRNILEELTVKGYQVSDWTQTEIENLQLTGKNLAFLTANDQPLPAAQGRDYLPKAAKVACNFLENRSKKGFFMMVEGSQIDWGGHAGRTDYIVTEMQDFDKTIAEVLAFAKRDGNTLVIVTADHETGGFGIMKGSKMGNVVGGFADKPDANGSLYHTGSMIPVFAYGPGAELFSGIYENTAIFDKMKQLFGF